MELRRTCLMVVMGLSSALNTGCLLNHQDTAADLHAKAIERLGAGQDSERTIEMPIIPPPPPPSNYLPRPVPVARLSASVEPDRDRGQLAVIPAVRSAAPGEDPLPPLITPPAPPAPEAPLVAALRCSLEKHPAKAQALLEKYEQSDREVLLALLKLTANVGAGEKASASEMTVALEQLGKVAADLRQRAPLVLERVCFCRKIDGFGQFDAQPATHEFQPGSEGRPGDRVHVYAELRNFATREVNGQFETTLCSSLNIYDMNNRKVATMDLGSCVDRCQTRRQDYFLNVQFHVPAKLRAGLYTLEVTVRDRTPGVVGDKAARVATRSLDFRVGSGTASAAIKAD